MRSNGRMNRSSRSGNGRPNRHGWSGRPFYSDRWWRLFARRGFVPDVVLSFVPGFVFNFVFGVVPNFVFDVVLNIVLDVVLHDSLSLDGRRPVSLDYRLGLRLSVRNRRRFKRSGRVVLHAGVGGVLGGVLVSGGGRRLRVLMAIIAAQFEDYVVFQRAGVRLLISDAEFGELLQYFVSFDFQLPRQLVNSDLSHR
jgi:hypothetical protein